MNLDEKWEKKKDRIRKTRNKGKDNNSDDDTSEERKEARKVAKKVGTWKKTHTQNYFKKYGSQQQMMRNGDPDKRKQKNNKEENTASNEDKESWVMKKNEGKLPPHKARKREGKGGKEWENKEMKEQRKSGGHSRKDR